ncbi:MAG: putative glycoside hydrolase [Paludibacter sp.]|nr:putative glycoside hydrolase [Bacteroidales bacterium]MCM1068552.1 putative glycoside hydrolase [Prevotella sp.]MCM1353216.1 putative glycoside hydrolase [Bacteroides sp.]MCM1442376.1 putative glycoside hydrolase [Muribaculum sp.]MCM1481195.1 putative glycoside hydrolase [Paludibacter sp.]
MKPTFSLLLLCLTGMSVACKHTKSETETRYIASERPFATLYTLDTNKQPQRTDSIVRGSAISICTDQCIRYNNQEYIAIQTPDGICYIEEECTVSSPEEVVLEKQIWVRTPTSIIDDTLHAHICGLAEKGNSYSVIGFDRLLSTGEVFRYKIRYADTCGYVFGKYVVHTQEEANEHYMPQWQDSIHGKVRNTFGGGEAIGCDFFPCKKPDFIDNPMPESCYSLYLNISPAVIGNIDAYITLAKTTLINTFVIDIKDNECPGYKAEAMERYSPTNYKWGGKNKEQMYVYAVKRLHEEGFYVVGRITCFKDSYFVKDHPECAITDKATGSPFFHNKAYWPSAYDRHVWQFNVELAKEAVRKFGFNEINFDYVRFPDRMSSVENQIDYHNRYNESKVQAIQRFVQYACDELHQLNVYVSIDVFGETANRGYTTPYGQYWPALSNVADVMCGMPYPDHFAPGYAGIAKPWNNPYKTLNIWGTSVQNRQAETPAPARVRTWIQAYHVMHHIDAEGIDYNAENITKEIRGLFDAGLRGGYITWLSSSLLERYQSQAPAFRIDYLQEQDKK